MLASSSSFGFCTKHAVFNHGNECPVCSGKKFIYDTKQQKVVVEVVAGMETTEEKDEGGVGEGGEMEEGNETKAEGNLIEVEHVYQWRSENDKQLIQQLFGRNADDIIESLLFEDDNGESSTAATTTEDSG